MDYALTRSHVASRKKSVFRDTAQVPRGLVSSSPVKMARNIQALRHGLDPSPAGYEAQLTYKHSAGYFHPSQLRSISLHNFPVSGLHSTK
ncbi:hypothetical protein PABG_00432 [Paracoccidioides brasiliensis Pb03]|nr:hypothetical protein PABG_00432 [Paracoccidioides brasiliensis Pb03]